MEKTVLKDIEVLISTLSSFPGFGFSPTDVELLDYYLKKKLQGYNDYILIIPELEINKFEPWDLPGRAVIQSNREWFYFNPRGKKYSRGSCNKRRTEHGYWKPTGTERPVRAKSSSNIIGKKRTLVFHMGRAPKGVRTVWIMHELSMIGQPKDSMSVCRLLKNTESRAKDPKPIPTFVPEWKINELTYYNNPIPFEPDPQKTFTNADSAVQIVAESPEDEVDQLLQLPSYPTSFPILEINEIEEIPMEIFQRSLQDALKRRYTSPRHDGAGPSGDKPDQEHETPPDLEHVTPPNLEHEPPPELEHEPKGEGEGKETEEKRKRNGKRKVTGKEKRIDTDTEEEVDRKRKRNGNGNGKGKKKVTEKGKGKEKGNSLLDKRKERQ